MENQDPPVTPPENPSENVREEIEKLKAEKEAILKQQENQAKEIEELNSLRAEIEELKKYTFPQEIKPLTPLEQIEAKYKRVLNAIDQGFPVGHQERLLPADLSYNGVSYIDGFYDYVHGAKIEDIFKDPLT